MILETRAGRMVKLLDGQFVRLWRDNPNGQAGTLMDFGFIRADILSSRGFEIARNGLRHYVEFGTFDRITIVE